MSKGFFFLVSGWPDSMWTFHSLYDKIKDKWQIFVLHFDHWVRPESEQEALELQKYFAKFLNVQFILWKNFNLTNSTEQALRKARRNWINQIVQKFKNNFEQIYIITWHNLTDRIETTILNMLRGAHLKGLLNMKHFEKKEKWVYLRRPLLSLPKEQIETLCKSQNIPYFVDQSNFDENFSQRNKIRKILNQLNQLSHKDKNWNSLFWQSWQNLYQILENSYNQLSWNIKIKPVYQPFWDKLQVWFVKEIDFWKPLEQITLQDITEMFDKLWIYYNIDQNLLKEFEKFIKKWSWKKQFQNLWFFKTVGKLFVMDKLPKKWNIQWKKIKWKPLSKYLAKKGIPEFLRGWVKS